MKCEKSIITEFLRSSQNAKAKTEAVNSLRHLLMDGVAVDVKSDVAYMSVYKKIMGHIASVYPILSQEVKRQIEKKIRRQTRRSLEVQESKLHIQL